MNKVPPKTQPHEPPAMGERRARWGYGYQDKIATERILNILRKDLREGNIFFEGVRLADLDAGRVDDFVLIWEKNVEGNSIKWSRESNPLNWRDLIGANGLLKELAGGYKRLKERWPNKAVSVRFQSNRPPSPEKHHTQLISQSLHGIRRSASVSDVPYSGDVGLPGNARFRRRLVISIVIHFSS